MSSDCAGGVPPATVDPRESGSTQLFINGKIFTGTGEDHFASAFRITDGAFIWVGDTADVTGEEATDLAGATVLPGFLDLHAHPSFTATLADAVPLPPDVDSLAASRATTRPARCTTPRRRRWGGERGGEGGTAGQGKVSGRRGVTTLAAAWAHRCPAPPQGGTGQGRTGQGGGHPANS